MVCINLETIAGLWTIAIVIGGVEVIGKKYGKEITAVYNNHRERYFPKDEDREIFIDPMKYLNKQNGII